MPKQPTERKRRRSRPPAEQKRNAVPVPANVAAAPETLNVNNRAGTPVELAAPLEASVPPASDAPETKKTATRRQRLSMGLTPPDSEQQRLADLYRLTRSPMPSRFDFVSPKKLSRFIAVGALLFSAVGTLWASQSTMIWSDTVIYAVCILIICGSYLVSTRETDPFPPSYSLAAIVLETATASLGVLVMGFNAPFYFPFIPFYIITLHAQLTFSTRPAIGLTLLLWISFMTVLFISNNSTFDTVFLALALMLTIPFFVITLVIRFVIREGRQRGQLIETLERLRISEERYRQVTDRANDAIFMVTASGRVTFANPKFGELTGYREEDLIGRGIGELLTSESRQIILKSFGPDAVPTETTEQAVWRLEFVRPDKNRMLTEVTAARLAGKGAGWVAIARDVTERFRMQEQIERRNRDLTALNAITSTAGQSLDMDRLLNDVVTTLVDVLKADVAGITLIEEQTRLLKVGAYKGLSDTIVRAVTNATTKEDSESLTHEVVRTGTPILISDLTRDKRAEAVAGKAVRDMGLRSYAAAPIKTRDKLLGVVSIISHTAGEFGDDDLHLLVSIGNSLAVAIENARLYGTSLNQVREMTCLAEIARAINLSESLGQTLTNIAQGISETLDYKACLVSIVDREHYVIEAYGGYGLPGGFVDRLNEYSLKRLAPKEELAKLPIFRALDTDGPAVYQIRPISGALQSLNQEVIAAGWALALTVPFSIQGHPVGVISCYSAENSPPAESEMRLLITIANQTSLAVRNAQLFREQQRRADQLRAVGEIGRQIGAILNLDDLLPFITRLLQQTFDYYMVGIYLADTEKPDEFVLKAAHGWNTKLVTVGRRFNVTTHTGKGLIAWVAQHGEPLLIPDVSAEGRFLEYDQEGLVRSELVVPIKRGESVIGVIDIASTLLNGFDEIDLATMQALAEQVSIALVNARLYTEVNRVVVQLTNANVELAEATRHKSEFLANMSHELRTPLNAIIGFSEVLQDLTFGNLNERQLRYVTNILTSGRHLLALVNDVLDLAKVEAGRMELHPEEFAPDDAITDVENIVAVSATKKSLVIENRMHAKRKTIYADKSKFKQIMYNLLSNAVKFTPERGRITVGNHLHTQDGRDFIAIWVKDTGIGIGKDDQARIFEEFKQVDSSYSRQHQGTGLGLALSKRLVELHGGRIWVESIAGVGSLFTFLLPVYTDAVKTPSSPAPSEAIDRLLEADAKTRLDRQVSREKATSDLSGTFRIPVLQLDGEKPRPTVLIIDDDDRALEILSLYFEEGGYQVETAHNATEALQRLYTSALPALITLDVVLPGKSGWELLNDLKQNDDFKDIPVLVVSLAEDSVARSQAVSFLPKPVAKTQLLAAAREAITPSAQLEELGNRK
jgi:PAS domain S-box-containing protein